MSVAVVRRGMTTRTALRVALLGFVLLATIAGTGTPAGADPPPADHVRSDRGPLALDGQYRPAADTAGYLSNGEEGDEGEDESGGEEAPGAEGEDGNGGEGERGDDGAGTRVVGEWWGLGGEASEAPYVGLAELGVVLLVVGVGGYSAGKRTSVVPGRHRRRLLQAHEWVVLSGTALTVPHFLFVEEWAGLGFLVGVLLGFEVLSGLYGRHLHRHAVRLGRGQERASLVGRVVAVTNERMLSRWRRVHVSLTLVTAIAIALHVLTAVGD